MDRDDIILETLKKIDSKQDEMSERINLIEITLAKNTSDVEYHIKRTNLLEDHIKTIEGDMKPINEHVTFVKNLMKIIASVGALLVFLKTMGLL